MSKINKFIYNGTEYEIGGDYVELTGSQTIQGVKTFSDFPVTPSSEPINDYDVQNKKFVLDTMGGGGNGVILEDTLQFNSTINLDTVNAHLYQMTTTKWTFFHVTIAGADGAVGIIRASKDWLSTANHGIQLSYFRVGDWYKSGAGHQTSITAFVPPGYQVALNSNISSSNCTVKIVEMPF